MYETSLLMQTREEILDNLRQHPTTRMLIVGGGVHGAALARLAGWNQTDCVLLERGDYASGTSCRSSKMAHGGLRYLENADFKQVMEGIRAREDLFSTAPHLVQPARFLIPVLQGDLWFRWKMGLGLHLYDRLVTDPARRHRYLPRHHPNYPKILAGRTDLEGCYLYTDGMMNDARLVLESILHARLQGVRCLNYVEVVSVRKEGGRFVVACRDRMGGDELEIAADLVVNCAGPWAPFIGHSASESLASEIRYSAGIHLLFECAWTAPALLLPLPEGKSRYYFVWPHPGGVMVGTTERAVETAPFDPMPTEAEIQEVLERLKRDLPDAGLDRRTLYYAFSGVRTLPLRGSQAGTARLSRRHLWKSMDGALTLLGGKFTTANATAWEGFQQAAARLGLTGSLRSLQGVPYPGSGTREEREALEQELVRRGLTEQEAARILGRLGVRARFLLETDQGLEAVAPGLLFGELDLALREEQAITVEDLLRRRTGVEYLPGAPLQALSAVERYLAARRDPACVAEEIQNYRRRIETLQRLLKRTERGAE